MADLDLRGFPTLDELVAETRTRVQAHAEIVQHRVDTDRAGAEDLGTLAAADALWLLSYVDWLHGEVAKLNLALNIVALREIRQEVELQRLRRDARRG